MSVISVFKAESVLKPPELDLQSIQTWQRCFLVWAALVGALGVALAALGAHAFADVLIGKAELRFATALRMHLVHAPSLLILAGVLHLSSPRWWLAACLAMSLGSLVFCGGLYLAALGVSNALLPIVPIGGATLIGAWLLAVVAFLRAPRTGLLPSPR